MHHSKDNALIFCSAYSIESVDMNAFSLHIDPPRINKELEAHYV